MQIPLQITFRGIEKSDAIESTIRERASRLERFSDRITRCHVTVDMPHQHHHRGNHYAIHIDIQTPTGDVAVTKDPSLNDAHKDFQSVVRDAFDAATRQLEEGAQRVRGEVKGHEHHAPPGRVVRLFPGEGYGFLATSEGTEVYFHENSVVDLPLARLSVGSEVRFTIAADDSDQGPRAASVHLIQS
jgi:cold shock CspA family protein/ribosome-associated translation inhibitor RaiA